MIIDFLVFLHIIIFGNEILCILQLDTILRKAVKFGKPTPTKKGVKNQEKFAKMQQMRCELDGIGVVKMIVGVKRSGEIIQYCITANKE